MFGLGRKREETEYERGYEASREFSELVDDGVTDTQLMEQWNIVAANHSEEYITGYTHYVLDELNKPWWKIW